MGEEKVLNKSKHPAVDPDDFDPKDFGSEKEPKNLWRWLIMLPMTIRCNTCQDYNYKGTETYVHEERVEGEAISRFYFRCNKCTAELTMKRDLITTECTMEVGASCVDFELVPAMRHR